MIRTMRTLLMACSLFLTASASHAAATPEQACQNGRYAAAAKYSACAQKATGKLLASGDFSKFEGAASKCRVKYTRTWAKLVAKGAGSSSCVEPRFDTGVAGTVTDRLTGLQWEQKTDDASIHDKDDSYSWTSNDDGDGTDADGTAFTTFLATLNSGGCFAGQCDWRLPTVTELQTILSEPYPCTTNPCIDGAFGPVGLSYWSATTRATDPGHAWGVYFDDGGVSIGFKVALQRVRAVRAGL